MTAINPNASGRFFGWTNVIFLFLLYAIVMGFVFYGFTVIFPAMIQAEGWGRGEASLAHTIRGLVVGLIAPVTAFSITKLGSTRTLRIGLIVGTVALSLLGTITTQLWQWTIIWGLVMPAAFALGGLIPIQTIVSFWFNRRRATALGVVMTGAAVAGFMAAPFYTHIMERYGTWHTAWLVAAGLCSLGFVMTFFIKNTPADLGQHPDGVDPSKPFKEDGSGELGAIGPYKTEEPWGLKEALRTRVVWLQIVCMIGQVWALYIITTHGVLHLVDKEFSQMQAASILGNLILFSGLARFPTGILADRIEPRILTTAALFGMAATLIGLWQAPQNLTLLLSISAGHGFCFGVTAITFPMITANYFGPAAFASINGFFLPIIISLSAPVPFIAGLIFDHYKSYDLAFVPITIMLSLATLCAWCLYPPRKKCLPYD